MAVVERSNLEVSFILKRFLDNNGDDWEWDDFISIPIKDKFFDAIRLLCMEIPDKFTPIDGGYCSKDGIELIEFISEKLRNT